VPSTKGEVYDLDYIQNLNWCQVLIRQPVDGFIGFVRDDRLQSPLETAMQLAVPVTVYHDDAKPKRIYRVVVRRAPPVPRPPKGLHYVVEVDVDENDGKCKATVLGSDGKKSKVFTRDARFESILVTALREAWKIGYLDYDPTTGEVSRGKLNIDDQTRK